MKSKNLIYAGLGVVGLSIISFFLYNKKSSDSNFEKDVDDDDDDDAEYNRNISDIQKSYGYTSRQILTEGGSKSKKHCKLKKQKTRNRKYKKCKK